MNICELPSWLSQVCEVITEPSTEALRPTMIDVQGRASAAKNTATIAVAKAAARSRCFRMVPFSVDGSTEVISSSVP
jgi:hypothetical protein